ncbi:hypothetical protein F5Y00DRAFT_230952 [Daldinia vernicosa]|uniref:uncharacterized protein n=1 Tax=Daldinia vernicosa TaxID=114800 RepID=UPI002008A1C2|nr:uncharacterized protein F5Y00DRAFT_230952 [Daldinia vernicosa]KAI0851336.1 hypothetical protein F5Y00DRAFT_230952 [Daldinia vernicosa]
MNTTAETLPHVSRRARHRNEKYFASPGGSVIPGTRWERSCASTEDALPRDKN